MRQEVRSKNVIVTFVRALDGSCSTSWRLQKSSRLPISASNREAFANRRIFTWITIHQTISWRNGSATEVQVVFTRLYAVHGFGYSAQILTRRRWATSICTLWLDTKASLSANQSTLEEVSTLRFATTSISNKRLYLSLIVKMRTRLRLPLLFYKMSKTYSLSSFPAQLNNQILNVQPLKSIPCRAWTSRIHLKVKFLTNLSSIQQSLASPIWKFLVTAQTSSSFRARNRLKS